MSPADVLIAVIGGAICGEKHRELAYRTGAEIGQAGATLVCGGRGGVMRAAAEGARSMGGSTLGILPGVDRNDSPPNLFIQTAIFTGMGQARNQVLVLSADAIIGIGGGWGTLTEIGLALKYRKPVLLLDSWRLELPAVCRDAPLHQVESPQEAVRLALKIRDSRE